MRYEEINVKKLILNSENILDLLVESYVINFELDIQEVIELCKNKLELLIEYVSTKKAYVIGSLDNDLLTGFVWFYQHEYYGEKRIHVNQIVIANEYRNKGIARRLLLEVERKSLSIGIYTIDLFVSENNNTAVRLYEKLDYITERRYMSKTLREKL